MQVSPFFAPFIAERWVASRFLATG